MYVAKYEPFENLLPPLSMSSVHLSVAIEVGNRIKKKNDRKGKKWLQKCFRLPIKWEKLASYNAKKRTYADFRALTLTKLNLLFDCCALQAHFLPLRLRNFPLTMYSANFSWYYWQQYRLARRHRSIEQYFHIQLFNDMAAVSKSNK